MTVFTLCFYLFAVTSVVSALMVVLSRNPVHSVLWLIATFLASAGLFVLMGAEFLAMLLIIVYVGAVAVLFIFVVMMLDIDFAALKAEMVAYMPLGLLIGVVLILLLATSFGSFTASEAAQGLRAAPMGGDLTNTEALGMLIYDKYILLFQLAGLVLLVAMIGAIVLTMRHRKDVKRQDVLSQMYRRAEDSLTMKDVKPGQGL